MAKLAKVYILLTGYFKWLRPNVCQASCTVSLIIDGKDKIIVDTGTKNNERELVKALARYKVKPSEINYIIITHYHTDHLENLGLFKNAQSLNISEMKKNDIFELSEELLVKGKQQLTPNVELMATPGHTNECLCVLVKTNKGIIAIAGDLFVKKQVEKGIFVENQKLWEQSRQKILKLADYILPGHGPMFKVQK
jgi:glyoxylase-like metal-dependent hydrolase (beta-lactamase superfamily II)